MRLTLCGLMLNAETFTRIISTALLMAFCSGMGLLTLSLLYSTASSSGTCEHRPIILESAKGTTKAACQASTCKGSPHQLALSDRCPRAVPPLPWQQQMPAIELGLTV